MPGNQTIEFGDRSNSSTRCGNHPVERLQQSRAFQYSRRHFSQLLAEHPIGGGGDPALEHVKEIGTGFALPFDARPVEVRIQLLRAAAALAPDVSLSRRRGLLCGNRPSARERSNLEQLSQSIWASRAAAWRCKEQSVCSSTG